MKPAIFCRSAAKGEQPTKTPQAMGEAYQSASDLRASRKRCLETEVAGLAEKWKSPKKFQEAQVILPNNELCRKPETQKPAQQPVLAKNLADPEPFQDPAQNLQPYPETKWHNMSNFQRNSNLCHDFVGFNVSHKQKSILPHR